MDNNEIYKKLEEINDKVDKISLAEYTEMIKNPRKMMFINLISGIAKGIGITIGATLFSSLIVFLLIKIGELNIPLVGEFLAEIIKVILSNLR